MKAILSTFALPLTTVALLGTAYAQNNGARPSTGRLSGPTTANETAAKLNQKAETTRRRAEDRLARGRRARLDERGKLTRSVQEAYARLAAAEAGAEQAASALSAARERRQRTTPNDAVVARRANALARLLGQAADIPPADRADDPVTFVREVEARVDQRMATLEYDTNIHERRGEVLGRDGRLGSARILRIGQVTALAVSADGDPDPHRLTGFVREQAGSPPIIVGPHLTDAAIAALRGARTGEKGRLPLDVDGHLSRMEAEAPTASTSGLKAGGVFVWPILAVGLLGVLLFLERVWYFVLRPVAPNRIRRVTAALATGDRRQAEALVADRKTDLDRVLATGIETLDDPRAVREQALETALLREEPGLERGSALLGAVAGLAPLLGLLGTVTGMITTFDVISTFGTGNPQLLSGGISVALITTQLGLIVAVPALLAHAWVGRSAAKRQALLEEARTAMLSLEIDDAGATP